MSGNVLFPIIIVAAVLVFVVISRSKSVKRANYDERQLLARNTAYKFSFFFLLIYCFTCGFLHIFNVDWADIAVQMFLGIILSFTLFIALCIIKDAYFSSSPKRNAYAVIFFFSYGVYNIIYLLFGFRDGKAFFDDGRITTLVLYIVASVCFFALGILSVIKIIMENRGAEK